MGYFYSSLLPKESTVSNLVGGMRQRELGLPIFNLRFCDINAPRITEGRN
jgi:hypothetical protein